MPRYGFSGESADMRKLILHICRSVGEPADVRELIRIALMDDNADYFLFSDALTALIENGLAARLDETVFLTPRGEETAVITERNLPAALRRAVGEECAAVRERQLRGRCVSASESDGVFTGILSDGDSPILELKLQTGSARQAGALKRKFEKNAEVILQRIWEVMTEQ
jgi:hypothetical protein